MNLRLTEHGVRMMRRAYNHIVTSDPSIFDIHTWGTRCGTVHCLGGWMLHLDDYETYGERIYTVPNSPVPQLQTFAGSVARIICRFYEVEGGTIEQLHEFARQCEAPDYSNGASQLWIYYWGLWKVRKEPGVKRIDPRWQPTMAHLKANIEAYIEERGPILIQEEDAQNLTELTEISALEEMVER